MKLDKDKLNAKLLEFYKKSVFFLIAAAKWISEVSINAYDILKAYSVIKVKESRMKYDFLKLGQEAYNQWESNQFFSIQESLNKLKISKTLIANKQAIISSKLEKIKELFDFQSESSVFYKEPKPAVKPEFEILRRPEEKLEPSNDESNVDIEKNSDMEENVELNDNAQTNNTDSDSDTTQTVKKTPRRTKRETKKTTSENSESIQIETEQEEVTESATQPESESVLSESEVFSETPDVEGTEQAPPQDQTQNQ